MGNKDIISKQVFRRLATDLATYLLKLEIDPDSLELIETEYQRIEDRRADLVARVNDRNGKPFILHIETQNDNSQIMPIRMMRYYSDIRMLHPALSIRQYLVYIGSSPIGMPDGISDELFHYRYHLIDLHEVDCSLWMAADNPDALVLAILCDFGGRDKQMVVNHILRRLKELTGEDEGRFREYFSMLDILSENRDLQENIQEARKVLTQVDVTKLASYAWGKEDGLEQGEATGERKALLRIVRKKFGEPSPATIKCIEAANSSQLEIWVDRLLDAGSIDEVFAP